LGKAGESGTLDYPMPSFGLRVPDSGSTALFRLEAINKPSVSFVLESPHTSLIEVSRQNTVLSGYFGLLAALMFYNAVIYRVLQQKFLLHYFAVIASIGLFGLCMHGYLDYLIPGGYRLSRRLGVLNYLAMIAGTGFTRSFLMT